MIILGIETSCDDTSAAVLIDGEVRSNVVSSQDDIHGAYGGVVPELAARRHLELVTTVVEAAVERAGVAYADIDRIAVTRGPGLLGSLLVGVSAAQGLALRLGIPAMGINHLEGHALSSLLTTPLVAPFLSGVVSGGHTALYLVREIGDYAEIASTCDDSAGEAFDKGAKMLGLGFPGGREIDNLAKRGQPNAVSFPRARVRRDPMAWSFSGLKTALWDYLRSPSRTASIEDVCASFQEAIVDVLVDRCTKAMATTGIPRVALAGGVAANSRLRARMDMAVSERGGILSYPPPSLCTDNAAMVAFVAWLRLEAGISCDDAIHAVSRLPLGPKLTRS
ncbi:MAG: tRNA (adenosine(37)-N6)-threonylcarbamoyltransferase complex transferase subunit TsaD [Myxococcales bacterium]|nr:MAG: tRNA (adenosine(37)-N6)-threonylcarbamoyltransferase complex transferase subunit TsaD [Myxococcales bacterium]